MNKQFATVAVMAALCLTLVGCGGSDGPNLRPELEKLTEQLEQVQDDLNTKHQEAADTQADTQEELEEAQEQLEEAKKETAAERQRREAAERQSAEERQKAEAAAAEAERKAQEQIRQQAQALEANQRARGIRAALLAVNNVVTVLPANLGVTVSKPKTLKIAASADYKAAGSPTSFTGFRSVRLRSPSTLGDGFQRTLVAYTDREASRDILAHLKENVAANDNKIQLLGSNGFDASLFGMLSASLKRQLKVDDDKTEDDDESMLTRNSFSSSLYGVTGNLICLNSGASCGITITTTAVDLPDTTASEAEVSVAAADGTGTLYFQPTGNRQIPLDGTAKFDAMGIPADDEAALTDTKFMVFGWWEERPDDTAKMYNIDVFGQGTGLVTVNGTGVSGTAKYVGRATGFYAETDAARPVTIGAQTYPFVEAGEFTAPVSLNVTFGSGEVDGTVGNFVKSNGSRPAWTVGFDGTAATLTLPGATATGTSAVQFVPDLVDGPAVGAVGTFDVGLDNVLELTGAFGAHKQ